jgi:hypothetical protein
MFSIVCAYSNKETFARYLVTSLQRQGSEYERIFIDNCGVRFTSASAALNYGGKQATGKYIMFVHQDVDFESATWLDDAEKMLDGLPELGVAGVAGISESGRNLKERGRNVILHGPGRTPWEFGNAICKPEIVQTLDCCVLIVPRTVFEKIKFDEAACDNWHLYGEDYCLAAKSAGLDAYVLPLGIYHASRGGIKSSRADIVLSLGALPPEYYATLNNLVKKYRGKYKYIYTTNGEWNTFQPIIIQRIAMLVKGAFGLMARKPGGNK